MAKRTTTRSPAPDSSYFTRLGMEVELQRLEEKAAQLRAWLGKVPGRARAAVQALTGAASADASPTRGRKRKRTMSADARRRISEAQKARWAKQRGQTAAATGSTVSEAPTTAPKAKRGRPAGKKKGGRGRKRES